MGIRQEKIWELLWGPIVRSYIDEETLHNWENEGERFRQTDLIYPEYYSSQNFHGITWYVFKSIKFINFSKSDISINAFPLSFKQLGIKILMP